METTVERKMPDNQDILARLDKMEEKVDGRLNDVNKQIEKLHDVLVELAKQQKDIDRLRSDMDSIRITYAEAAETRIRTLENIQAGCKIKDVEGAIHKIWGIVTAFVFLFVAAAVDRFWGR